MDLSYLQELLPEAAEETLTAVLEQHQSELTTLQAAAQEAQQARAAAETALGQERRSAAAEKALEGLEFSSNAAKTAFLSELGAAELPLEDGTLKGFHGFLAEFRAKDPGAFRSAGATMKITAPGGGGVKPSLLRKAFGL